MATFGGRDYSNDRGDPDVRGQAPDVPRGQEAPKNYPDPAGKRYPERPESYGRGKDDYDNRGGRSEYEGRGRGGDGGSGRGGDYDRDPNFAFISYLYKTGNRGGFSVFLKRDMLEILKSLEDDDVLGISPSGRGGWMLYSRRVPQEQKEEYRRGSRGRSGGRY